MPVVELYIPQELNSQPLDFFFNSPEYINLHITDNTFSFYLKGKNEVVLARIHFTISDGIACSFSKAPFGFLETSVEDKTALKEFLIQIDTYFLQLGVKKFLLYSWPECYNKNNSKLVEELLIETGYSVEYSEYDFYLEVKNDSVNKIFKKPEKKRLRKCLKSGFEFLRSDILDSELIHDLLLRFRNQRNIPLNISQKDLNDAFSIFPDRYFVFLVKEKEKAIAVSVCVEVNSSTLYHFVLAADDAYNSYSPSVMIYDGVYKFCQERGYKIFDFGTASIKGIKQQGLFTFKENLGGLICLKPVFSKLL